jgi:predicted O-methyltransferase YrrM
MVQPRPELRRDTSQPRKPIQPSQFERYIRTCEAIPGWFSRETVALWDSLLSHQVEYDIGGNLFEIGVFNGRSAALAAMHARPEEALILVDKEPLSAAQENVSAIKPRHVAYLQMDSRDLHRHPIAEANEGKCRWLHVDGEHSESGVTNDLELAMLLLSGEGVVAVDDFMHPAYPQITRAIFRYLDAHEPEISLFLCGFNQAYLCRPSSKPRYLAYIRDSGFSDMAARGCASVTFFKTNRPGEINCFGVEDRYEDFDYRGLDEEPAKIVI